MVRRKGPREMRKDGGSLFGELTIAYLFLGGVAAGSLLFLSLAQLAKAFARKRARLPEGADSLPHSADSTRAECDRAETGSSPSDQREGADPRSGAILPSFAAVNDRFYALVYAATALVMTLGMLCLAFDLPHPDRAILLFAYPTSSVLSVGSIILGISLLYTILFAAHYCVQPLHWIARFRTALALVGIATALAMALYPGILLMTMPADQAWHSPLVPILFTLSAFSTGIALLTLCFIVRPRDIGTARFVRQLVALDGWLIVIKVVATLVYLVIAVYLLQSWPLVEELLFGRGSMVFWVGYATCGLAAPFVLERMARTRPTDGLLLGLSVLLLIGGYCLRLAVVGLES